MNVEPWKLMLGIAGLLVIFGIVVSFGGTEPGEFLRMFVYVMLFVVLTYGGYRLGNRLGENRLE